MSLVRVETYSVDCLCTIVLVNAYEIEMQSGAASFADQPDAQVMLVNSVKDVAAALIPMINSSKNAFGKPGDHPAVGELNDSAKLMASNVYSLLKTVNAVDDAHQRGIRAVENAIEAIQIEINVRDLFEST